MTGFHLSDLLASAHVDHATVAIDNARGHGKQSERERRRRRHESRMQSQLYMCRKPRRTADEDGDCVMVDDCDTNPDATSSLMYRRAPSFIKSMSSAPDRPPLSPKRSSLDLQSSPLSVQDFLHQDMMAAAFHSSEKDLPRKPVRRTSIEDFEPVRFSDESPHRQLRSQATVCLAEILSSIEL